MKAKNILLSGEECEMVVALLSAMEKTAPLQLAMHELTCADQECKFAEQARVEVERARGIIRKLEG